MEFTLTENNFLIAVQTIDHLIETGNSEQIFQTAMQDMGRGQVLPL